MIGTITAIIRGRKTTVFLMVVALILGIYNYVVMPQIGRASCRERV